MSQHTISFTVNGQAEVLQIESRRLLCDALRDDLLLTGTKRGCETGVCGACSVLVDDRLMKSCLMLALQVDTKHVMTVEGLAPNGDLHVIQASFAEHGGLQCGYCTPGFLMATVALLKANPNPNAEQVREALEGNICRCTGYTGIVESVLAAATALSNQTTEL
jgi:aerobic carbon-monoxide dehydrogenase small subunit